MDAVDGVRADRPNDQQHRQQYPGTPPSECPGGNEQQDGNEGCIRNESGHDSDHRHLGG